MQFVYERIQTVDAVKWFSFQKHSKQVAAPASSSDFRAVFVCHLVPTVCLSARRSVRAAELWLGTRTDTVESRCRVVKERRKETLQANPPYSSITP